MYSEYGFFFLCYAKSCSALLVWQAWLAHPSFSVSIQAEKSIHLPE